MDFTFKTPFAPSFLLLGPFESNGPENGINLHEKSNGMAPQAVDEAAARCDVPKCNNYAGFQVAIHATIWHPVPMFDTIIRWDSLQHKEET